MGLLKDLGLIEDFQTTMALQQQVKAVGLKQFFNVLKLYADWTKPMNINQIKWGEQIEGHFLQKGEDGHFQLATSNPVQQYNDLGFQLVPEYGSWMFQMIPSQPYSTQCNFNEIIQQIRIKYHALQSRIKIALTIPIIPFIGLQKPVNIDITNSLYIDDKHISNHLRFKTLTKHIRLRRGCNVQIFVPLYIDTHTKKEQILKTQPKENYIHLDAMAFGMGLCCLQCTFSTKSLPHARYLYDQLNVLSPLFLALTAGSPFIKGKVSDWDVRWNIICGSVDDRTANERNPHHADYIPTSRYCQASYYISNCPLNKKQYNDFDCLIRKQDYARVEKSAKEFGIQLDQRMAYHIANLFRRDLLIVYKTFPQMSEEETYVFEMLNGTNWNSVRLKIPIDDKIGWRVQFRTMEVQLTADENSAYSLMIHLITRILHQNLQLNFYIPISRLRQNFARAHRYDAVRRERFFFRTNIFSSQDPIIAEMTLHQILFGRQDFIGIFALVESKMIKCVQMCPKVLMLVSCIKRLLMDITTGKRLTLAQYMRSFVYDHPDYHRNSILSSKVMDDLMIHLYKISKGEIISDNFYQIFPKELFIRDHATKKCYANRKGDCL